MKKIWSLIAQLIIISVFLDTAMINVASASEEENNIQ